MVVRGDAGVADHLSGRLIVGVGRDWGFKPAVPAHGAVMNGDPPVGAPTPDGARRDAVMRGDGTDAHIRCRILRLMVGLETLRTTSLTLDDLYDPENF